MGAGGVPLLGTAACPGRPPMWAGGVRRRGVLYPCRGGVPEGAGGVPLLGTTACPGRPPMWAEGCAGGVCHSPAEGVCQSRAEGVHETRSRPRCAS